MEKDRRTRGCRGRSILDFGWTRSKTLSFRSPSIATVPYPTMCSNGVLWGRFLGIKLQKSDFYQILVVFEVPRQLRVKWIARNSQKYQNLIKDASYLVSF